MTRLGRNLLFLSRGGIYFLPLESARTKNRPGTICVWRSELETPVWWSFPSPWDETGDGWQREACGLSAKAGLKITWAGLWETLDSHVHTQCTHRHLHIGLHTCTHTRVCMHNVHTACYIHVGLRGHMDARIQCTWVHTDMHTHTWNVRACKYAHTHIHTMYTPHAHTHTMHILIPFPIWVYAGLMKQL